MPVKNIVGGDHFIDEEMWVVSLARKKVGQGSKHAFLIIEGFYKEEYKIVRADLFIKGGEALGSSYWSGPSGLNASNKSGDLSAKVLPGSGGKCVVQVSNASGTALVVMKQMVVDDLKKLAKECEYKSYGITVEKAEQLVKNIAADMKVNIGYNLCGDGSIYSLSFLSERYESCVSWAINMLAKIDIKVEGKWHDFILMDTSKLIPPVPKKEQEEENPKAENHM